MSTIQAVIFDLDDTLYPEMDYNFSGFNAVSTWAEEKLDIHGFYKIAKEIYLNTAHDGKIFNRVLEHFNIKDETSLIDEMILVYRTHVPNISLYSDAQTVLHFLARNYKLGLLTDGYHLTQQLKVKALGVEFLFDTIVYSDQYGRHNWKPSKLPYHKASETLQVDPSSCLYVGDNPNKDFISAKSLGWKTVRIDRGTGINSGMKLGHMYEAEYEISTLSQLPCILTTTT